MDPIVSSYHKAWDRDYASRGRVWGGGVKDLPRLPAGFRVLELGSGDGKTLAAMPCDWEKVALDVSPQALRLASRAGTDASFILADASSLPLTNERFDAVFSFHVAGHLLAEQRAALSREVVRVLMPGGRLFFRDFAFDDMRAGNGKMVEPGTYLRKNGIITHFFDEDETKGLFSGLMPEAVTTHRWRLRVRGDEMQRAEVQAVFLKVPANIQICSAHNI
ncbi:MAG: class I SAM-dependent methyltransferase [Methanothrix sp.]|nr:class I SAM-dependent methyltransferase [Methanothrix sp.]